MKALEKRTCFNGLHYNPERSLKLHQERLKSIKNQTDTRPPSSYQNRTTSPNKTTQIVKNQKEHVTKENLILAKKIFNIMEGPGAITEMITTDPVENHPGTLNFRTRLLEAQRIHEKNMILAARLNTIEPHYRKDDSSAITIMKNFSKQHRRPNTSRFAREMDMALGHHSPDSRGRHTTDGDRRDTNRGYHSASPTMRHGVDLSKTLAQEQQDNGNKNDNNGSNSGKKKPHNVLLEYTKIQNGRVLDVAVIKEPFRDRYAIFGIDIDDGQRYELRLSSEQVSNILDGDILVTSVDNVEVWMALLNKIDLLKVDMFAKVPLTVEEMENAVNRELRLKISSIATVDDSDAEIVLRPPAAIIPSSRRPMSRAGVSSSQQQRSLSAGSDQATGKCYDQSITITADDLFQQNRDNNLDNYSDFVPVAGVSADYASRDYDAADSVIVANSMDPQPKDNDEVKEHVTTSVATSDHVNNSLSVSADVIDKKTSDSPRLKENDVQASTRPTEIVRKDTNMSNKSSKQSTAKTSPRPSAVSAKKAVPPPQPSASVKPSRPSKLTNASGSGSASSSPRSSVHKPSAAASNVSNQTSAVKKDGRRSTAGATSTTPTNKSKNANSTDSKGLSNNMRPVITSIVSNAVNDAIASIVSSNANTSNKTTMQQFQAGELIETKLPNSVEWMKAKVVRYRSDNKYDLLSLGGDRLVHVDPLSIRVAEK